MITIRPVTTADHGLHVRLCDLLIDAVHGGASVGFLAPLSRDRADAYWTGVFNSLDDDLHLWVAVNEEGKVVGSVQLAMCAKENGRHRAEIQKLLVLTSQRGLGIASRLMRTVEAFARSRGRTLLVLDTLSGSDAEAIYAHLGWQRVGEIPGYAGTPAGDLRPTVIFYRRLE